jgi:hypothetical protein
MPPEWVRLIVLTVFGVIFILVVYKHGKERGESLLKGILKECTKQRGTLETLNCFACIVVGGVSSGGLAVVAFFSAEHLLAVLLQSEPTGNLSRTELYMWAALLMVGFVAIVAMISIYFAAKFRPPRTD